MVVTIRRDYHIRRILTEGPEPALLQFNDPVGITDTVVVDLVHDVVLWFDGFDTYGSGDFAWNPPPAPWVADGEGSAGWRIFNGEFPPGTPFSVLYPTAADAKLYRTTGLTNHRIKARYKMGGDAVGGVVCKVVDVDTYIGFELVLGDFGVGPEDKLVVFTRDGATHDEFFTLFDAGLVIETWYELELEYDSGTVRAWLDGVPVVTHALAPAFDALVASATDAGAILFQGGVNYDWLEATTAGES